MSSRNGEPVSWLTQDEQMSLEALQQGPVRADIPFSHAERLIGLGLADLAGETLRVTAAGRNVLGQKAAG